MFDNDIQNIILGLGIGVFVAGFIVDVSLRLLEEWGDCRIPDPEAKNCGRIVVEYATGFLERLVYILLLVSEVSAAAAFMGTWILAKVVTGWNLIQQDMNATDKKEKQRANSRAFVSLLGSLISLLFGLLGAYLWRPESF
jgi:hypothetical protein